VTAGPSGQGPLVSLFGAYRRDGELDPRPLVVDIFAPLGRLGSGEVHAAVRGEDLTDGAEAIARIRASLHAVECCVRFVDAAGASRQIVVTGRLDSGCLRAKTELTGFVEGPGGVRLGSVRLRLNWRAVRLRR
jgi:hypothetical protein